MCNSAFHVLTVTLSSTCKTIAIGLCFWIRNMRIPLRLLHEKSDFCTHLSGNWLRYEAVRSVTSFVFSSVASVATAQQASSHSEATRGRWQCEFVPKNWSDNNRRDRTRHHRLIEPWRHRLEARKSNKRATVPNKEFSIFTLSQVE